jgi:hypothetical protein
MCGRPKGIKHYRRTGQAGFDDPLRPRRRHYECFGLLDKNLGLS